MSEEEKNESHSQKENKKALQQELKEYKEKYLRLLADAENSRKRLQKEKQETIRFAIENTISDFLPALDNFENALKFSEQASEEVQQWATGFTMILSQFRDVLHNNGIIPFYTKGNMFDPHEHEAMEIVETSEHPDGTILEEFAKGYKSGNRTLRAARVKVAKSPVSPQENNQLDETKRGNNNE
ncbi:MAG: nucleotide exchange factor GrpE [Parachlamydiales bacterium]|nr:nucleotide exchange factor GrpE [Parachlamydiales bacterium]